MDISTLEQHSSALREKLIGYQHDKSNYEDSLLKEQQKKSLYENEITMCEKCTQILTLAAQEARKNAKDHFEKIITDALQFVTQDKDYEFVIDEMTSRAKASYEFYVKSTVNGVECKQKPEDANGGGFVDIIASAAKYAYLEIFNDPKIMSGTLLYDEPGKMISAEMSVKYAEYLKFLGNHYGRQTIMITHNETLSSVADKTFVVTKNLFGISQVADSVDGGTISFDDMGIEEILNGN